MNTLNQSDELLKVINLSVSTKSKKIILNRISFNCLRSEILVLLGKNGQGKTTLSLSLTNLLNKNIFHVSGKISFKEIDILSLTEEELNKIRQKNIGYIFQNPFSSFNPIQKIEAQFDEQSKLKNIPFKLFLDLMNELGLKNYNQILKKYPFELSGGTLQRLSVIRCLASNPELIIADEPTSALDKPIAIQLLNILNEYVKSYNASLILITQDISIGEKYADRIALLSEGLLQTISRKEDFFQLKDNLEAKIIIDAYNQLKI